MLRVLFCFVFRVLLGTTMKLYHLLIRVSAFLVAQMVENLPSMWEIWIQSLGQEAPLENGRLPTQVFLPGEFHGQRGKESYSA